MRNELRIKDVTRTTVEVPFRDAVEPHMQRMLPDWRFFEICEVKLASGETGYGETMVFYSYNETTDEDVERVIGSNAVTQMWDDDIGSGLQLALFDAIGRTLDIPVHELLGDSNRESVPLSWWCVDMPPADWAAEASKAHSRGYEAMKVKARPWWDLYEAVEAVTEVVPSSFQLGLDFNTTLFNAERAIPILKQLASCPIVNTFEEPINRHKTDEYRQIREAIDTPIAHHFSYDDTLEGLATGVADRFLFTDGASDMQRLAGTLGTLNKPMWYQIVGTGITASWGINLASTLDVELLPSINCHRVFAESLLDEPIDVSNGETPVPDTPGLGYDVDTETIERLTVDMDDVEPNPERLLVVEFPDGRTLYFATGRQLRKYAQAGNFPQFEPGIETRVIPDDGSSWWRETRDLAADEPGIMT